MYRGHLGMLQAGREVEFESAAQRGVWFLLETKLCSD